ncbi:murein hydrolase activator EnvC family protein [Cohnella yongneupensis]|uniref:Murein hydrolase activator EnvC family protein n=1 Tax=Cohnella yongneupensis TaxID=425006 RepID=A0ABW0R109_9BACL
MKRKFVLLLAMLVGATMIVRPYEGQALTQVQKIDQELNALRKEMEQAANNQKSADNKVHKLNGQKAATKEDIDALNVSIQQMQKKLTDTQDKIDAAEDKLRVTGQELEDAIKQRDLRLDLMDNRVRMAYMAGPASFLDVLMDSTDLPDFLTRLDSVEAIVKQDNDIAEQASEYKDQVVQKKQQVEQELTGVKTLYAEMQSNKAELESNEQAKEQMLADLSEQISEAEEISDEAEAQLKKFAKRSAELQAKKKALTQYYKGGKLGMPLRVEYHLSSPFGYRIHPIYHTKRLHTGMDMAVPKGTPIYAAESGRVITARSMSGYGNCVIIDHGGGLWTVYGHIMNGGILVKEGQEVKRGEKIALVGSTGDSTGNHLHFEVRKNSEPVNPVSYLK